jgi:hypothetical protein
MFEADGDHSYLKDSAGPLSTAQKASRSNTPIADIKPASNAKSRITSIKRVSVFFGRFTVIYGSPQEFEQRSRCLLMGRVFGFHPRTKDLQGGSFSRVLFENTKSSW